MNPYEGIMGNEGEMKEGGGLKTKGGKSMAVVKTCPGWITKPGMG